MVKNLIYKIIGDPNDRELKKLQKYVDRVNELEPEIQALSDNELKNKTPEFKNRLEQGETLEDLLPEAFAVVREASNRVLGMRHFDVQVLGGVVLHQGRIAEMKTGEGKTLVATMPAYLNALTGKGVHIITVNDYLAQRDSEWMGEVYNFLGLEVGLIVHGMNSQERRESYACDIVFGTNNEFGFDYLRDNMALYEKDLTQRELNFAIIDEVDSILVDEARTPLIISGASDKPKELYYKMAKFVPILKQDEDYTVDEKANSVMLTEDGVDKAERFLGVDNLYDDTNLELSHHLNQALKAHALMKRDNDYVVENGQVVIVDQFTGRKMPGRRYSDGLHQAIEAKEGVQIEKENQTLASITFQNFFKLYNKLSGMTGTAATEEEEFQEIYGMDVVIVPTNEPMIREDLPDRVYKTEEAKFQAVADDIEECYNRGQPVLVGTVSIEKSEELSHMLKKRGVSHQVLNAKHHEKEAEIIKNAGQKGTVTIATNMAGRGTDIVLGPGVKELGGLYVIGTERHESRRIDNQLRGRSGRQGDPGASRFYVSLEDDLMRLFGSDNIYSMMDKLGMEEDQAIDSSFVSSAIENAQKKVEGRNFSIRKHVLEYDNVMDQQRKVIYEQRRQVLQGDNLRDEIMDMISDVIEEAIESYASEKIYPEEWDLDALMQFGRKSFLLPEKGSVQELKELTNDKEPKEAIDAMREYLMDLAKEAYQEKEDEIGEERMREVERVILLRVVDSKWMDHLDAMEQLRQGIGLRAYGQKNPLVEYKYEGYQMFQNMIASIKEEVTRLILRVKINEQEAPKRQSVANVSGQQGGGGATRSSFQDHGNPAGSAGGGAKTASGGGSEGTASGNESQEQPKKTPIRRGKKIGRNEPCPCGSGKKYKKCCGKPA
ncbi:preprotein translocase subunit SecA [Natranaerobius thermophilus]|uniref:Protein translocase subunit SecA n=1 Tax=Natranaerobius thermophilus (strain ATCC BAA-1301 / DSM 18059 / JW/NM-WN-LF) TaxID=457570 RepID=B2A812_NATTJ|nr:preprotein translocase subunit SecA [Natranaerobius thermophilus]ACB85784.1 protein translocase subunit secA [Natranaerobius thermophilus JW/NM-WN-LF]